MPLQGNDINVTLADKDLAVVFDHEVGRGTKEIHVDEAKRHKSCLTDSQVQQLRDLGRLIAEYRHPKTKVYGRKQSP